MLRRLVPIAAATFALTAIFACSGGSGDPTTANPDDASTGDASCDGSVYPTCSANGTIGSSCCPKGAACRPEPICDLGGGKCRAGACVQAGGGTGSTPCGSTTCTGSDVCVFTQSGGGACQLANDAGLCPDGQPPQGNCCNRIESSYACKALPASCHGTLDATCASSLCQCGGGAIDASKPNTVSCNCLAP